MSLCLSVSFSLTFAIFYHYEWLSICHPVLPWSQLTVDSNSKEGSDRGMACMHVFWQVPVWYVCTWRCMFTSHWHPVFPWGTPANICSGESTAAATATTTSRSILDPAHRTSCSPRASPLPRQRAWLPANVISAGIPFESRGTEGHTACGCSANCRISG